MSDTLPGPKRPSELSRGGPIHTIDSLVKGLKQPTTIIDLILVDHGDARRHRLAPITPNPQIKRSSNDRSIRAHIHAPELDITRSDQHRARSARPDSIPPGTAGRVLGELGPGGHHALAERVLLRCGVGRVVLVRAEDERDLARVVHAQARVPLRVGERGVEVVPPGWDADAGGVVGPFRLGALEDVLGEDLRDLVIGRLDAV